MFKDFNQWMIGDLGHTVAVSAVDISLRVGMYPNIR
jgi:hypothetical protein